MLTDADGGVFWTTSWFGVPVLKTPTDMWNMQVNVTCGARP
jgi:cephalosporin hydroxylase